MKIIRRHNLTIVASIGFLLLQTPLEAQVPTDRGYMNLEASIGAAGESKEVQIARAIGAGPETVTGAAKIVGADANGKAIVLREGSNGFTCVPGNPKVIGHPASCANEAALQWSADLAAGKPNPTNKTAGFVYMLSGATEPGSMAKVGPQWMITWPFDPQASGLSATKKDTGAFIQWAGTPYAHLHIMGQPLGKAAEHLAADHKGHMAAMGVHDGVATGVPSNEPAEVQIARAISAGPKHVTDGAQITGTDAQGKMIVLREGNNGFTCRAGSLNIVAQPPQCNSTKSKPTIIYMLAGATQRSISDPDDKKSPSLSIGPHWMIMLNVDPKTSGIPETYSDTGAYVMWSGSRMGHMHIMGVP